jgi:hypothetical protein
MYRSSVMSLEPNHSWQPFWSKSGVWGNNSREPALRLQADVIVDGTSEPLLASEVAFGSLHRNVAQQKLDLLQFPTSGVAETRTGTTLMPHAALAALCRMPDHAESMSRSSIWRAV